MGKTIKKVLRIVAYTAILTIVSIILFGVYYVVKERLLDRKHLNYRTNFEWTIWNKYYRIQKRYDESEKRTILRKVNFENQSEIRMYLDDDYRLVVYVKFFTKCTPGTYIKTTVTDSNSNPGELTCKEIKINEVSHTYLATSFKYNNKFSRYSDLPYTIENDLDGFKYNSGYLSDWKLDELKKEITLLRAQPKK